MSLESTNRVQRLKDRAHMLKKARSFFDTKNIVEVDVPALSKRAPIDLHIDLIEAVCLHTKAYLHSSPEYGMKRLLAEGIGDIYQLSHVFRNGEVGEKHNPEFTMVEWYRCDVSFDNMIEETIEFLSLFLGNWPLELLSFEEAFRKYALKSAEEIEDIDACFAFEVEPHLGKEGWTLLKNFPPHMAALAKTEFNGKSLVAKRFEIFFQGFELANGYEELTDVHEQKRRLDKANFDRAQLDKPPYPLDDNFLQALQAGLPNCCGVAVGFDRLMMLRHHCKHINEILPFAWERA